MLTWTSAGAVARPDTLQIRLQRAYPGRVRAGAPVPTRSMPTDEVVSNLRHFAVAGTRGRAVSALVLSGVGAARRDDLGAILAEARQGGVRSVVLHAGVEDVDALERSLLSVDRVVLPLGSDESGATLAAAAELDGRSEGFVSIRDARGAAREAGVPAPDWRAERDMVRGLFAAVDSYGSAPSQAWGV
jgi:hypothetical protein